MTINRRGLAGATGLLVCILSTAVMIPATVVSAEKDVVSEGKSLAFDRKKGNCLACHMMGDGAYPGNIAPPLIAMKSRFPDKAKLRAQIWDPTAANPESAMPPFGKHQIISDAELDKIVEYIWTL